MSEGRRVERRARWLARSYPKAWRGRYGDEFDELLVADLLERPRSFRRDLDVLRGGLVARLSRLGLSGSGLEAAEQVRAWLGVLGCCVAVSLAFSVAMWSQLGIGWQWSRPSDSATSAAVVLLSVALLAAAGSAIAAAAPILWALVSARGRRAGRLLEPTFLVAVGAGVLVAGGRHFANGWPGTGGHPWASRDLVPGGVAAFSWASSLSVSSYWAHPSALARFPHAEVAWMLLSPLAWLCVVAGAVLLWRRVELTSALLRFEARLAALVCAVMAASFAAA
ncbi:MAG TPA: hypothetical protein VMD59_05210, partial [Acidimicrobiales bacterium]|nr:hypothetical protein [Acidimicrobiales bacterium]